MWTTKGNVEKKTSSNGVVAVAVNKDKNSQYALRWAIDNLASVGYPIVLIHVVVDPSFSGTSPKFKHAYQKTRSDSDLFFPFGCFCSRKDIRPLDIIVRDTDVAKALSEYVSYAAIENLVLGASRAGLIRKFRQADVPAMVLKEVPDFCNVFVISKSTISSLRIASRPVPFQSPLKSELDRLTKEKSSIVEQVDSPPPQSLCITESVKPKITANYLMEQRRRKAASNFLGPSPRQRPDNEPPFKPIKDTPLDTFHPSNSVNPAVSSDSTLIQFPVGFGSSENVPNWPHLSQLLLPGPASVLEQKAPPEVADQTVENLFVALQSALHSRKVIAGMRTEIVTKNAENAKLKTQLAASINKEKTIQDQLIDAQSVHCSLSAALEAAEHQVLLLKKTLAKTAAFAAWESKIKCIRDFQNGEHLTWDLKEEEKMFAQSFPCKPDLSILDDFALDDSDDEFASPPNNVATGAGTSGPPNRMAIPAPISAEQVGEQNVTST